MIKRMIPIVSILLSFPAIASADQRVCQQTAGAGFSDIHTGAGITGNWSNLAFNTSGTGGTGQLFICTDNAPTSPPTCSTIDVNLTADGTPLHSYWVTSDDYPGWGYTTTIPANPKKTTTTVLGGKTGVLATFSLDSDSDLVLAKLVDMSGIIGYNNLCGQLWNTLGAVGGNPICETDNDCAIFASGDFCLSGNCVGALPFSDPSCGGILSFDTLYSWSWSELTQGETCSSNNADTNALTTTSQCSSGCQLDMSSNSYQCPITTDSSGCTLTVSYNPVTTMVSLAWLPSCYFPSVNGGQPYTTSDPLILSCN